jgi:hypothetical protein
MPYTQVQFVSYDINTMPLRNADGSQTYLGLADAGQDIEARCALMLRAMQAARDNLPQPSPPPAPGDVLKVFMAPEFFFRGATGAYQVAMVDMLVGRLQALAADPAGGWADWVFSFGTIVCGQDPVPNQQTEIYNFALIQEGGVASSGPGGARVVMKELTSGIDFIAGVANPGGLLLGEVIALQAGRPGPGRETQQVTYDGGGVFTMRGITWAMDICLDHMVNRLVRSPQLPGEQVVQVQLVPSAGTDPAIYETIPGPGGFVFHVDGAGWGSDLRQVGGAAIPSAPPPVDVGNGTITLTGVSPPQVVAINMLYQAGPGRILYFAPQKIPDAATVPGSRISLVWEASENYEFTFDIVHDPAGNLSTVLLSPKRLPRDIFGGHDYFLPMQVRTADPNGVPVQISARQGPGSGGYSAAIWCKISVPGFLFEGNVLQFMARVIPGTEFLYETIW